MSGCNLIERANKHLQAAQGDLQQKRAVSTNIVALSEIEDVDIVAFLPATTLASAASYLEYELNVTSEASKRSVVFSNASISASDSSLLLLVDATFPYRGLTVTARTHASAFLVTSSGAILWNAYLNGFEILEISGVPCFFPRGEAWANGLLVAANSAMNAILDEAINNDPENAFLASLSFSDVFSEDLGDLSSDDLTISPKTIAINLATQASALHLYASGLWLLAEADFTDETPALPVPEFPSDRDLVRVSDDAYRALVEDYRRDFFAKLSESVFSPLGSSSEKSFLAASDRKFNQALGILLETPVSGTFELSEESFDEKTLKWYLKGERCERYFSACESQDICGTHQCVDRRTEIFEEACRKPCRVQCDVLCCRPSPFGDICVPGCTGTCDGLCDDVCEIPREVVKPITTRECNTFHEAVDLFGQGLCSLAQEVDGAICDTENDVRDAICAAEDQLVGFFNETPVATFTATTRVTGTLGFDLRAVALSDAGDVLHVEAKFEGRADVRADLKSNRHSGPDMVLAPPGILVDQCLYDWNAAVDTVASLEPFTARLPLNVEWSETAEDALSMNFSIQSPIGLEFDLDPEPLPELLRGEPSLIFRCPVLVAGSAIFAAYESQYKPEEDRQVLPLISGQDYPYEVEDLGISARVKPAELCLGERSDAQCSGVRFNLVPMKNPEFVVFMDKTNP